MSAIARAVLLRPALLSTGLLLLAAPAGAVTIDWVTVGDPGNAPDSAANCFAADCGSVAGAYQIARYEVTNAQYTEFLNAKAASDPKALYNAAMESNATFGGITRSGSSGSYSYAVKPGFADKPVTFVSFWDSVRFTNWLGNGQGGGDTETGSYTLTPAAIAANSVMRNPGAITFLPSENEWYKAAYYGGSGVYFEYPTGTDAMTGCVAPGSDTGNSANCYPYAHPPGTLTDVGAYALSDSPSGTFDQGGNVREWNEQIVYGTSRGARGGSWNGNAGNFAAPFRYYHGPGSEFGTLGFRVAALVPEPGTMMLVMTGLAGLAWRQRRS